MPSVPEDVDLDDLKAEQQRLAERVRFQDDLDGPVERIGGFDAAYGDRSVYGALAVLEPDGLETVETVTAPALLELPYIPGLLAYRELPAADAVLERVEERPDVLLVDGGGRIHPRGFGSASHIGVRHGIATVGVTKSLLLGEVEGPVREHGDVAPVRADGVLVGYALLSSRRAKNPIYVSPGHRVGPQTALSLVQRCCTGERKLPEPVQRAHEAAGEARDRARV